LLLANKQDLLNSRSPEEISEELNLASINNRPWTIIPCSARDGEGLADGIDWVMKYIN
jgi:signal recognition particle receptor subunit beta